MLPIIAAILKGLAISELQKSTDDPAAKAGIGMAAGKIADKIGVASAEKAPEVSPMASASESFDATKYRQVPATPAQSIYDKFREDNYRRSIGEMMGRR